MWGKEEGEKKMQSSQEIKKGQKLGMKIALNVAWLQSEVIDEKTQELKKVGIGERVGKVGGFCPLPLGLLSCPSQSGFS